MKFLQLLWFGMLYPFGMNFKAGIFNDERISMENSNNVVICYSTKDITFELINENSSRKIKLAECHIESQMCGFKVPTQSYKVKMAWVLEILEETSSTRGSYACYETYDDSHKVQVQIKSNPVDNDHLDKDTKRESCSNNVLLILCAIVVTWVATAAIIIGVYERRRISTIYRTLCNRGYTAVANKTELHNELETVYSEGYQCALKHTDPSPSSTCAHQLPAISVGSVNRKLTETFGDGISREVTIKELPPTATPYDASRNDELEVKELRVDESGHVFEVVKTNTNMVIPHYCAFRRQSDGEHSLEAEINNLPDVSVESVIAKSTETIRSLIDGKSREVTIKQLPPTATPYDTSRNDELEAKELPVDESGNSFELVKKNTNRLILSRDSSFKEIHTLLAQNQVFDDLFCGANLFCGLIMHCTLYHNIYNIEVPQINRLYLRARARLKLLTMRSAVDQQNHLNTTLQKVSLIAREFPGLLTKYSHIRSRIEKGTCILVNELHGLQHVIQTYVDMLESSDEFQQPTCINEVVPNASNDN